MKRKGGGAQMSSAAKHMYKKAKAANDAGDYFPVFGTCLGFEWLLIAESGNDDILDSPFDAYNYSIPLEFTDLAKSSEYFGTAPTHIVDVLATKPVTMNNHHGGIALDHWQKTASLNEFFDVLSTNVDRNGWRFVSTIEAKDYPIFGSQWHPEKNAFEWYMMPEGYPYEAIDHSPDGIAVGQYMSNFLVSHAKKSKHSFSSTADQDKYLMYNYTPVKSGPDFVQTYFFPRTWQISPPTTA